MAEDKDKPGSDGERDQSPDASPNTTQDHMHEVGRNIFYYISGLTHWPLVNLNEILAKHVIFKWILVIDGLTHLLWNCPNMNVIGLDWWSVDIGSGNGLVPSGNKPLPESMLTQISVAIWRH